MGVEISNTEQLSYAHVFAESDTTPVYTLLRNLFCLINIEEGKAAYFVCVILYVCP